MIHMLSRFDLMQGVTIEAFEKDYVAFFGHVQSLDLAETTGKIGSRITDTPMDTDAADAQQYYVVMSFRDREQLDRSYEYFLTGDRNAPEWVAHQRVYSAVVNPVFTCWQDSR